MSVNALFILIIFVLILSTNLKFGSDAFCRKENRMKLRLFPFANIALKIEIS